MHANDANSPSHEPPDDSSDTRATGHAAMAQGDMQMQGGDAPKDARDPHAYSDGYTLTEGPYALPGPRQLKLADEHRFWSLLGDRLEYDADNDVTTFDLQGWYGTTYDRLVITLQNGQVWRQLKNNARPWKPREPMVEPLVTMERSMFGGYRLRVDGVNRTVQVKRID